jgi:hypothetical protein
MMFSSLALRWGYRIVYTVGLLSGSHRLLACRRAPTSYSVSAQEMNSATAVGTVLAPVCATLPPHSIKGGYRTRIAFAQGCVADR